MPRQFAATATTGSRTNSAASGGLGWAGAASPLSGYGPSGGSIKLDEATIRAVGRLSHRDRARLLRLIAAVRRLGGCLGNLPDQLRVVLELATGVNAPRALSSAQVANYLHIRVGQVYPLEKRALRQLRLAARTHACNGTQRTTPGLLVLSGFGPALGGGTATGGVEATRYTKGPSRHPAGSPLAWAYPSFDSLLGIDSPPVAGDTWLIILLVLGGGLLIGILFADQERRSRWLHRPRR
jgi:hypothetical protein